MLLRRPELPATVRTCRRALAGATIALFVSAGVSAQSSDLRDFLTNFLTRGITLAPPVVGPPHVAHFTSELGQFSAFNALNQELALQLESFPLPSSSGGFTYTYDPSLGTFTRGSDSFGPIYAERVDTVGKGRFNVGLNWSQFTFDELNGLNLDNGDLKLVFGHVHIPVRDEAHEFFFEGDVIQSQLSLKITDNIAAFVATYGITNNFDVGLAVPYVWVSIGATSDQEVNRLATADDPVFRQVHRFPTGNLADAACNSVTEDVEQGCTSHQSANGVGDVLLRFKYRFTDSSKLGVAMATDARFPSGNENDLLGTGVFQIRAYAIASGHFGIFSPHLNAGYTWAIHRHNNQPEGSSGIPDQINYTGGFDLALGSHVTFAFDVIGTTFVNTQIVTVTPTAFVANTNNNVFNPDAPPNFVTTILPQLTTHTGNLNTLTGSGGFKINPFGNFLITLNALFALNSNGLVDHLTPMVGIDYAF
jgi:hypothetical protein